MGHPHSPSHPQNTSKRAGPAAELREGLKPASTGNLVSDYLFAHINPKLINRLGDPWAGSCLVQRFIIVTQNERCQNFQHIYPGCHFHLSNLFHLRVLFLVIQLVVYSLNKTQAVTRVLSILSAFECKMVYHYVVINKQILFRMLFLGNIYKCIILFNLDNKYDVIHNTQVYKLIRS